MYRKLHWPLMAILITLLVLTSIKSEADTITITKYEPYYGSYDEIAGDLHTAYVETDQPYGSIDWYVDGVYQTTHSGDGMSKSATFDYTFNTGSTTGSSYEIRARAYPASGTHDDDSYNVTVWTDLADVSTPSRSVSDEMEVNGSYAISFSLVTPNSNYVITSARVWVNGSQVASQSYDDVTSATIDATGSLDSNVGQVVSVQVSFVGKLAIKAILLTVAQTWQAAVRSTIHGDCTCWDDGNALDNHHFRASNGNYYDNSTTVKWDAGSQGGSNSRPTSPSGTYTFQDVPCGYNIEMTVTSTDYHLHGSGANLPLKKCTYSHTESLGQVGDTLWSTGIHWETDTKEKNFVLQPASAEDP